MNKLPPGRELLGLPHTVAYIEKDMDTTIENLQHLLVTVRNRDEALNLLHLLFPGAHMIAFICGHMKMVDGKVVPFSDK